MVPPPSLKDPPSTFDFFSDFDADFGATIDFCAEFDLGADFGAAISFIMSSMTLPMALDHTIMIHVNIQLSSFGGIADVDVVVPVG